MLLKSATLLAINPSEELTMGAISVSIKLLDGYRVSDAFEELCRTVTKMLMNSF
ncbi:hypothetical protein BHE74_00052278 [Ensete ventricosum]|nr:hypothetical protein GW17_00057255 [Ensete ventricosum]RWW42189.1 hypothetical protein BHE74_00052278 [Ensete ventricosum]RZS24171.1 hypothetical protein BHM03_00057217 [Ensete ventricosum]